MHPLDVAVLVAYFVGVLAVGLWFLRRNSDSEDYYLGGRSMGAGHIGLSVVATDVGGGFSIGLGGLGFALGMSGSWMLFTGLLGAWLTAVVLIPRVHRTGVEHRLSTYPEMLGLSYGKRVAVLAAWISAIGYLGFTASQLLAGAKLASATVAGVDIQEALLVMGVLAVLYTALGGMKAVIYTDTVQWALLMLGLLFVGIPVCYSKLGGMEAIRASLPEGHLRLDQVGGIELLNWLFTIVPIWFVAMTLYQRIYASRDARTARRAWFVAGLLEWPIMAFLGVVLGLLGRVAYQQGLFADAGYDAGSTIDSEYGLPLLISSLLPIGLKGLMIAAYFSAILSTADSCLMAASGNLTTDLFPGRSSEGRKEVPLLRSQVFTLVIGGLALALASQLTSVLDLMLYSYAFMVSGLLVPTIGALVLKRPSSTAAITAMLLGGGTTITLTLTADALPLGLDANVFGIAAATAAYAIVHLATRE